MPSGDRSANPASIPGHSGLQRWLLSFSSAQKYSGAGRLTTPLGVSRVARSAVSCRFPASGHRASRSKYTRGQSRETGSLSRSPGGVGALAKRVSLGPVWADSDSLVFLRDGAGLRTVVSNRRLLRQSWCHGPGLIRAGPSGEDRGTSHYTVPVSPQCPQEISLLNLPVFQGTAVSSDDFSQFLPPGNVPERLAAPLTVSRAARAAISCVAAWKLLWNVSRWVMHTVKQGYHSALPLPFNWVIPTLVGPEQVLVMEQEVSTLLRKEVIEVVLPLDKESGFYCRTSLFLGRIMWLKFRILFLSRSCLRPYMQTGCHERSRRCILPISNLPHHMKFLRYALGAKRINIGFFPSALHSHPALSRCVDTALARLWLQGIHTLNHIYGGWHLLIRADGGLASSCRSRSHERVWVKT